MPVYWMLVLLLMFYDDVHARVPAHVQLIAVRWVFVLAVSDVDRADHAVV